ncbi:hypothetical protein LCGC14_0147320 [marine sediment metagenome]|uniref:Uncharacterized protein n=1 Tax=marine sediment metagenome TaxID=412755 RepID=A0A0F9V072_9ZZZZ
MTNHKRKKSDRLTKQLASKIGARVNINSGAFHTDKGDLSLEDDYGESWKIEHKYTDAAHYTLKLSTFLKAEQEAKITGSHPVMVIEFTGGRSSLKRSLAVLDGSWSNEIQVSEELSTDKKSVRISPSLVSIKKPLKILFESDKRTLLLTTAIEWQQLLERDN